MRNIMGRTGCLAAVALFASVAAFAAPVTYDLSGTTTQGGTFSGYLTYDPSMAATGGTVGGAFTVVETQPGAITDGTYQVVFGDASVQDTAQQANFYTTDYAYALDLLFNPNTLPQPTLCVVSTCPLTGGGSVATSTFFIRSGNSAGDPLAGGTFTPTPEPGSLALLGSGLLGVAGIVRRRVGRS